ncbi:MAG: hypothetical protein AB8B56_07425 [Crocinitomicaceae bacterium]
MKLLNTTTRTLFLLLILVSCKVTDVENDVVINELILLNTNSGITMEEFKEAYLIGDSQRILKRNRVYDEAIESFKFDNTSEPIQLATIVSHYEHPNFAEYEEIVIKNGYPIGAYTAGIFTEYAQKPLKVITYEKENISGTFSIHNERDSLLYETTFSKGNGYWKDFYLNKSVLREEGPVENNFKSGTWKYYNQSGEIDSTETYTIADSVDLRFPYHYLND